MKLDSNSHSSDNSLSIQSEQNSLQYENIYNKPKVFTWFNCLIFIIIIIFIIFSIGYIDNLNKSLISKIEKQKQLLQKQIQKLNGLYSQNDQKIQKINGLQSYNDQKFKRLYSKIEDVKIRNLHQPSNQEFSHIYCLKQPLIPNQMPSNVSTEILINTRHGFQMYVNGIASADGQIQYLSRKIMQQGTFEPDGINLLGRLLRPGYKVLNVGSQTGMEAILSAKIIGPKGHIYIFQPSNFSNYLVNKNFKLNNLTDRADIYKLAASDVKKTAILYINKRNTGGNSLVQKVKVFDSGIFSTQEVQVEIIDNIIPSEVSIDLALIDVEWHEVQVLFGMKQLIKRSPYMVILLEWAYLRNNQRNQTKTIEIINFLIQLGFEFYKISGFDPIKCVVGRYIKMIDPSKELLTIDYANIVIAPSAVILP